jgi:anti-sigma B factor antagonist
MQIEQRSVGGVIVVDVTGKITLGDSTELLKDKVNSLVNQGHKNLLLNLAGVSYMDSAGLGVMMAAFNTAKAQGGSLKLLSLTKRITDLLFITKLSTIFETFELETEAVASFATGAASV